jgi:hypothetical protein
MLGARVIGAGGVMACVLCCLTLPVVTATITGLGLGFLRNDRLLFPAEVIFAGIVLVTLIRSRARHARNEPLVLGAFVLAIMFWGLKASGRLATLAAMLGAVVVVGTVVWDWSLQKRCRV